MLPMLNSIRQRFLKWAINFRESQLRPIAIMSEPKDNLRKELLLRQYERLAEDWRHLNTLAWQIPTATLTVTSIVFAVSYGYLVGLARIAMLALGLLFSVSFIVLLVKTRFLMDVRSEFMKMLEEDLGLKKVPLTTGESVVFLKERKAGTKGVCLSTLYRISAFKAMLYTLYALAVAQLCIIAYEIALIFALLPFP